MGALSIGKLRNLEFFLEGLVFIDAMLRDEVKWRAVVLRCSLA